MKSLDRGNSQSIEVTFDKRNKSGNCAHTHPLRVEDKTPRKGMQWKLQKLYTRRAKINNCFISFCFCSQHSEVTPEVLTHPQQQ